MRTHRTAGQQANVQPNNAPPSKPTADAGRVARAEWWIFNDCPDAGADAFASAVEAATVLRDSYRLSSSLAETQLNDVWNRVACDPPLKPPEITEEKATPTPSTAAASTLAGTRPLNPSLT